MTSFQNLRANLAFPLPPNIAILFGLVWQSFAMPTAQQAPNSAADGTLTTDNNSTTENTTAGVFEPSWGAGPTHRGTMTLVFSCVITLFLCIWTTVQVNIEPRNIANTTLFRVFGVQGEDRRRYRREWVNRLSILLAKRWVRKLGWSCVTIIVPEATLAVAMYERRAAWLLTKAMKQQGKGNGSDVDPKQHSWNITLSFYAVMGGFRITNLGSTPQGTNRQSIQGNTADDTIEENPSTTQTNNHGTHPESTNGTNKRRTLTPQGVFLLYQRGLIPHLSEDDVLDKSKVGKLTKVIVFFQALWMIVQVISRTASALPVTLLELHTCVHTFCALITYATWWNKPVDVDLATPVPVDAATFATLNADEEVVQEQEKSAREKTRSEDIVILSPLGKSNQDRYLTSRAGLGKLLFIDLFGDARKNRGLRQGYFDMLEGGYGRLRRGWKGLWKEALAISFVGVVYGGLHLAVWQNEFPTRAEEFLWRIAAVITAVAWSGFMLSIWVGGKSTSGIYAILFGLCVFPCLSVRLYLLFESFFSLRRLPLGSYQVPIWSQIWPHVS
jgi:hypothetical protein